MGDRDERLDAVGKKAVEELVVAGKLGLVRGLLFARRIDARPGNGGAQDLETQLGEELGVLGIAVVEVDGRLFQVADTWKRRLGVRVAQAALAAHRIVEALASFMPGAFGLVRADGASPEESFRECVSIFGAHGKSLSSLEMMQACMEDQIRQRASSRHARSSSSRPCIRQRSIA